MREIIRVTILGGMLAAISFSAAANPAEVANKTVNAVSPTVMKVEAAVKRGLKKAEKGIQHGSAAAGNAVSNTAKKLGLPSSSGAAPVKNGNGMNK